MLPNMLRSNHFFEELPVNRLSIALLCVFCVGTAAGQKSDPPASHARFGCDTNPQLPASGIVTTGVIVTDLPDSNIYTANGQKAAGMQKLSGLKQYSARVLMHTPEDNFKECSVRQFRLILPRLQTSAPDTRIQVTIESPDAIGEGAAMILFSMERYDTDQLTECIIDAQTPAGYQSPYTYFANITVIGKP
jgi:hypothetical protein